MSAHLVQAARTHLDLSCEMLRKEKGEQYGREKSVME